MKILFVSTMKRTIPYDVPPAWQLKLADGREIYVDNIHEQTARNQTRFPSPGDKGCGHYTRTMAHHKTSKTF